MRKSILIALVSLLLAVLLISCGSKNQDDPTPSQPDQSGRTDKLSLPQLSCQARAAVVLMAFSPTSPETERTS